MKKSYLLLFLLGNLSCVFTPNTEIINRVIPTLCIIGDEVKESVPFDSLFQKETIVTLETTTESLIKKIGKVALYKDNLYILDTHQKELFQFDLDGHFVRRINHLGYGPGEYSSLVDFQIKDEKIYLLDRYGEQVLTYNMNDSLLSVEKMKKAGGIEVLEEGYALNLELGAADNAMDKQYCSYSYYSNGNYTNMSAPFNKNLLGLSFSLSEGSNAFYHFNDSVFTLIPFNDTIYFVNQKGVANPYQIINIDNMKIELDDKPERIKRLRDNGISTSVFAYYKLQDYFFFSYYNRKQRRKYVLSDSRQNIIFNTSLTLDADKIPIRIIAYDSDLTSNTVLSLVYPSEIMGLAKRYKENNVLSGLVKNLEEESNPLLIFYSFCRAI